MNKREILSALVMIVLGLVVIGCICINLGSFSISSSDESEVIVTAEGEELQENDLITVGFSQVGSESVWRTANTASLQVALSKENGFNLIVSNARQKQDNQIKAIRSFISQGVDYIVIAPITEKGWDEVLYDAREAGIPVIIIDRMVEVDDASLYTAFVGTDKTDEGRKAGVWAEEYCKEKGIGEDDPFNIVVLMGTAGSTAQLGRSHGFNRVAAAHRNWNILAEVDADFTTSKGKEIMASLIKEYPDIDLVVSQNDDMTFGAVEALTEAGYTTGTEGKIAIVSFDGVRKALRMVRDGIINCDVECNPLQGEYVAEIINNLENGVPIVKINNIEEKMFTIYNVNGYINSRKY